METTKVKSRDEVSEIIINDPNYKEVDNVKYLGSLISSDNDCSKDVKERIAAGNRCFFALMKTMKTRYLSKHTKLQIYNTIIKPVVMYGCEAWVMTEKTKQQLERWERKILRKIYGPIKDKNGWRIRTNSELTQLYKKPNIITLIKAKRIEWIGHVSRMDGGRSIKKIFEGKFEGRRDRGRPRLRWTDCVERDLCSLGVRNWRRKAENRNEWAIIIKEALAKL